MTIHVLMLSCDDDRTRAMRAFSSRKDAEEALEACAMEADPGLGEMYWLDEVELVGEER